MKIFVVGLNHGRTPVHIRGKLAINASQLPEALADLHSRVTRGIILSTCNRTEVYAIGHHEDEVIPKIVDFLSSRAHLSEEEMSRYIYIHQGESAVRHLYFVACGLDSMILGEYEILGQVKYALEEAENTGLVELCLLNLFRSAILAGRRVRAKTGLSKNALSVSSMAVDLAVKVVGDIRKSKVVIIGAGEAGRKAARISGERGAEEMVVVSRDPNRGLDLAEMLRGVWSPMDMLDQELIDTDILICCTAAPHSIVKFVRLKEIMEGRPTKPLVIIDIAVPPDVDSKVKHLKNVFLYDIDELNKICQINKKKRLKEASAAKRIIATEVEKFISYWDTLEIRPVISSLVQKADRIRKAQLDFTLKKIKNLSEEDSDYLDAMTRAIMQKILHDPIQRLKCESLKRDQYIQVMCDLFKLDGNELER